MSLRMRQNINQTDLIKSLKAQKTRFAISALVTDDEKIANTENLIRFFQYFLLD